MTDTTNTTEHRLANGRVTIQNKNTGEHRTFQIRTNGPDASFAAGKRCIALLTGPDNERSYTGFGFVSDEGRVHVYKRKCAERGDPLTTWQWYALMLQVLVSGASPDGMRGIRTADYDVLEERRCIKCNRTLTDPESIRLGIGPTCRGDS